MERRLSDSFRDLSSLSLTPLFDSGDGEDHGVRDIRLQGPEAVGKWL